MNLSKPKTRQPAPNLEIEQWVQGSPTNIDQEIGNVNIQLQNKSKGILKIRDPLPSYLMLWVAGNTSHHIYR